MEHHSEQHRQHHWVHYALHFQCPSNNVFSCPKKLCFAIVKSSQEKYPLPRPSAVSAMKLYYQEATSVPCNSRCIVVLPWYCHFLTNYLFLMESLLLPVLLLLEKFGYDPRHSTSSLSGPPTARTCSILNSSFLWRKSLYLHSQLFLLRACLGIKLINGAKPVPE